MDRSEVERIKRIIDEQLGPALQAAEARIMASVGATMDAFRRDRDREREEIRSFLEELENQTQRLEKNVSSVDAGNLYIIKRMDGQDEVLRGIAVDMGKVSTDNARRDGRDESRKQIVKGGWALFGSGILGGLAWVGRQAYEAFHHGGK